MHLTSDQDGWNELCTNEIRRLAHSLLVRVSRVNEPNPSVLQNQQQQTTGRRKTRAATPTFPLFFRTFALQLLVEKNFSTSIGEKNRLNPRRIHKVP